MPWQKIDDQFGIHRKVIRIPRKRRVEAVGLWTLALNYAGRNTTNGVLEEHELEEVLARREVTAELIRAGLWHASGHVCESEKCGDPAPEGGITIHDFLMYNPSRDEVVANREAERVRKESYRKSQQRPKNVPPGHHQVSAHPVPVPVPEEADVDNDPGSALDPNARANPIDPMGEIKRLELQAAIDAQRLRIQDVYVVRSRFEGILKVSLTVGQTIVLAEAVMAYSSRDVENPDAYLRRVCENTPEEIHRLYEAEHVEAVR